MSLASSLQRAGEAGDDRNFQRRIIVDCIQRSERYRRVSEYERERDPRHLPLMNKTDRVVGSDFNIVGDSESRAL